MGIYDFELFHCSNGKKSHSYHVAVYTIQFRRRFIPNGTNYFGNNEEKNRSYMTDTQIQRVKERESNSR